MQKIKEELNDELLSHQSILEELEHIKLLIDDIGGKFDLTIIKPIPVEMIKELTDIKEILKDHARSHPGSSAGNDHAYYIQRLGSTIDYLYKYNKALSKYTPGTDR